MGVEYPSGESVWRQLEILLGSLEQAKRTSMFRDDAWIGEFPDEPGVYAVFREALLIYIGETASIRKRMRDLRDTRNHTLRRKIGKELAHHPEFIHATASKKYPDEIERLLTETMRTTLTVAVLPVFFGRKELEEYVIRRLCPSYNKKPRRGSVSQERARVSPEAVPKLAETKEA